MAREQPALRGTALLDAARDLLRQPSTALLVDVDGTLSPIAPRPELATVSAPARSAVAALVSRLTLVAAVSGRSAADAHRMLHVPGALYVGNHGMEALTGREHWTHPGAAACRAQVARALRDAERALHRDDLLYEPKGLTASIHYRGAADAEEAREAILAVLAVLPDAAPLRITEGRQVVELRPPVDVSKGTAVACLVRRYRLCNVLFLGDDRTDLDAVRTLRTARAEGQIRALAVGVDNPEVPDDLLAEADGIVDGVAGVEALLTALAADEAPRRAAGAAPPPR